MTKCKILENLLNPQQPKKFYIQPNQFNMPTILNRDPVNAFCKHAPIEIRSTKNGRLQGCTFAVKDIYDIAGVPTAFGSPAWLNSHPIPTHTAAFITKLVDEGASLVGKTHTDELTYSILGMNAHYGTPTNSAAPNRVPGGSSSGSASAVAAGLVDFAIGSDTGGSVRAPASFCGIYGIRPSHGRISLENARPLAKSFDTLGWFARDPGTLLRVGEALLNESLPPDFPLQMGFLKEAFDIIHPEVASQAKEIIRKALGVEQIQSISLEDQKLSEWSEVFRILQAGEVWQEHGAWANAHMDTMGPGIKERFQAAKEITAEQIAAALQSQRNIIKAMDRLLKVHPFVILPTVIDAAPLIASSSVEFDAFRKNSFQLLCMAGLNGLPQITLPLMQVDHAPFGISILARRGMDMHLLKIATILKGAAG